MAGEKYLGWVALALAGGCGQSALYECRIEAVPPSLNFGANEAGIVVTRQVALTNVGYADCHVSALTFTGTVDPAFSLPASQPTAFLVATGAARSISVVFSVSTGGPAAPHRGTLSVQTGDPSTNPPASIPLSALACDATCGPGCSDGTREGFVGTNLFPRIAGCGGGWSLPGLLGPPACGRSSGNSSPTNPAGTGCAAADLCASGFHICRSQEDVSESLGPGESCNSATSQPNLFFATAQGSPGCGICTTGAECRFDATCSSCSGLGACENDVFGCGTLGQGVMDPSCGVLNVSSNNVCVDLTVGGWTCISPPGVGPAGHAYGQGCTELGVITKTDGYNGGGVLCCMD